MSITKKSSPLNTHNCSLSALQEEVVRCRLCPRLVEWRERVGRERVRRFRHEPYWGRPIPAFGDPTAALVVIGLAPAAHGGNRTGRMFTGDRSGDWLFEALYACGFANQPISRDRKDGLELRDCWITAAVRCVPPANKPLSAELACCSRFLHQEIAMLDRAIVFVALGRIAFGAFLKAWKQTRGSLPVPMPGFGHANQYELAPQRWLISSYHPSQQNTLTRRLTRAMLHRVFLRARKLIQYVK